MANTVFEVMKPGLSTTVQDLGRTGYQQYGIVVSGAMDRFALQVGNILVGNWRGAAGLEIAMIGPELRLLQDTVIAVCGADVSPTLDGMTIPLWKSLQVKAGQILRFGQPKSGLYAYLTVAGGIEVRTVMGSRATYVKAKLGGFKGRRLQKEDVLKRGDIKTTIRVLAGRRLTPGYIPDYGCTERIRVVIGPDHDAFTKESMRAFLSEKYEVTSQSDRMGYRLKGPKLQHASSADIISDAILPGTIQVPANGEPIVLLADRQTTGGYARIATVISVDLPYVAQMAPGYPFCFEPVSVEEAQGLFVQQEKFMRQLSMGAGVY